MHLLWLFGLLVLLIVSLVLFWVIFCFSKKTDSHTKLDFSEIISDSPELLKYFSDCKVFDSKHDSFHFPRFIQQFEESPQRKQKQTMSTGVKHLKNINKQIEKDDYFVSAQFMQKERKLRKNIRRKKGMVLLPTIYENVVYFDDDNDSKSVSN